MTASVPVVLRALLSNRYRFICIGHCGYRAIYCRIKSHFLRVKVFAFEEVGVQRVTEAAVFDELETC